MNKAQRQAEWKAKHLKALATLGFIGSYRTLRTLENQARGAATAYSNGDRFYHNGRFERLETDDFDAIKEEIRGKVAKLFEGGQLPQGFRLNSDPRGSAFQLDSELTTIPQGLHKNFGGQGVLAPEEF